MMKYLILPLLAIFACKKQNASINYGYNSYYHIENGDTLSWIHVPNSFTPNGDGINDLYNVITSGVNTREGKLFIYDGSGTLIFQNPLSSPFGWDGMHKGTKSSSGWYTMTINASDSSGYKYDIKNDLYLMR